MANGNNGYAPEDGNGLFSSLSGEKIMLEALGLEISLEFTSGNSIELDLNRKCVNRQLHIHEDRAEYGGDRINPR